MIGSGGLRAWLGGGLGSSLGNGGGELFRLDRIFIGKKSGRKFGDAFTGGEGEGAVSQPSSTIGIRKFLGDFFVHIEGGFCFIIATKDFGQFHENSQAVAIVFFAE